MKVYSNGELISREAISEVFEPGFLFGWGVFEPLRTYKGALPFLNEHLLRLDKGLELLGLEKVALDWKKIICELLSENKLEDAYVRITAYKKRKGTGILIYADTFTYYTRETYEKGFSSLISPYRRHADEVSSSIKSLSYLQNRLSWLAAQKAKKDEALVVNQDDFMVGGSRSNVFIVEGDQVLTPSLESGAFDGVTRRAVMKIIRDMDLTVKEERMKIGEITTCTEAFITSTLMEVMPLVECEEKPVGNGKPGKTTLKILSEYRKIISP